MAIMGIVFVQNITMLSFWEDVGSFLVRLTGTSAKAVIYTIVFAVLAIPAGLLISPSRLAGRAERRDRLANFALFGYALIPLDVAAHLAHNMFHLLAKGKSVVYTALALVGRDTGGSASLWHGRDPGPAVLPHRRGGQGIGLHGPPHRPQARRRERADLADLRPVRGVHPRPRRGRRHPLRPADGAPDVGGWSAIPRTPSPCVARMCRSRRGGSIHAVVHPRLRGVPERRAPAALFHLVAGSAGLPARTSPRVAHWLLVLCGMILVMVVIGGLTRLTHSGLSMVEWQPQNVLPPMGDAEWRAAFEDYQRYPEYRIINPDLDLAGFKEIFWFEYVHRLWGRLIGLALVLPLAWFLWRRAIARSLMLPLVGVVALFGLQGVLGWVMVASGLADRPDVSHYRLAAHLIAAFVLYLAMLWIALRILRPRAIPGEPAPPARLRRWIVGLGGLALPVTVLWGAFVAGLKPASSTTRSPSSVTSCRTCGQSRCGGRPSGRR